MSRHLTDRTFSLSRLLLVSLLSSTAMYVGVTGQGASTTAQAQSSKPPPQQAQPFPEHPEAADPHEQGQLSDPRNPQSPSTITLPDSGTCAGCAGTAFSITNTGEGRAGYYYLNNLSSANPALEGRTTSRAPYAIGLLGYVNVGSDDPAGTGSAGVKGMNSGRSSSGYGVYGVHAGSGIGVYGRTTRGGVGVYGYSDATSGMVKGVYGSVAADEGFGGYFVNNSTPFYGSTALIGLSNGATPATAVNQAVYRPAAAFAGHTGVIGVSNGNGYGVFAVSPSTAISGRSPGLFGIGLYAHVEADNSNAKAVYGDARYPNNAYAGYFNGKVKVVGGLQVTGPITNSAPILLTIDHPQDPANKYLTQTSVQSPEMKNVYDGNVTTDSKGEATVILPSYVQSLNTDFRYQLTVIGQFANAIVSSKIKDNRFTIKTDKPGVEVSWQVTGIRQDAYAKAHPVVTEEQKTGEDKGKYLHPIEQGQPATKGILQSQSQHPQQP